jgi:hypothetical protein
MSQPSQIPGLAAIKVIADGASVTSMLEAARDSRIAGFTTNPTLMRKAGVSDHAAVALEVLGQCAVVWHLLVSHPALKRAATKWESTK